MQRIVPNILWASFLTAIAAEGCLFAWFDPDELLNLVNQRDRLAAYTAGFFFLWLFCAISAGVAFLLNLPGRQETLARPTDSSRSRPPTP
ncbi:hypothetical protein [Herbaspirillum sp. RV1423]|uniref:hypothetical protein n=1 Tax=Herbaspirillum sp. RV1423 TaxID=1443993 RepID=UPI0004BA9ABF|nr:hypothetical protein [Herbaspirillum sp. RV1423]